MQCRMTPARPWALPAARSRTAAASTSSCRRVFRGLPVARAAPLKVTQEELEVAIGNRDRPMVVDFYAVAADMDGKVQILKVDVDENPNLSTQLQIQGLPTMIFIGVDPDKPALRTEGLLPADTIKKIIADELS